LHERTLHLHDTHFACIVIFPLMIPTKITSHETPFYRAPPPPVTYVQIFRQHPFFELLSLRSSLSMSNKVLRNNRVTQIIIVIRYENSQYSFCFHSAVRSILSCCQEQTLSVQHAT